MANPNITDINDDDAADLKFPKDCASRESLSDQEIDLEMSVVREEIFISDPICCICKSTLTEPFIRCAECENITMCPLCFSNGCEIENHKNNHDYVIVKNEFPLIEDTNWSAKEELKLLNVLQECGFGNWQDVGRRMVGKSAEECKNHYLKHYLDYQSLPGLPKIKETRASLFGVEPIPYSLKLHDLEEPPRFSKDSVNSRMIAGYNPARSDFEVNFDNYAELLVSELKYDEFHEDDENSELGESLQAALVEAYNNRLKERERRREIIREHGLIAFRKTFSWLHRYDSTIGHMTTERLLIFMQLVNGLDFDYIMEGLHHAGEIRNYLSKLFGFRENGMKYIRSVKMFKNLSKIKAESDKERKIYMSNAEYSWKSIMSNFLSESEVSSCPSLSMRRPPPPLEIRGLPGHEKLTSAEKDLCSNARIVPASYLDFKNLLIAENKKLGSLRLAAARHLLKIDVNKTRKIYDFLAQQGYINKPNQ